MKQYALDMSASPDEQQQVQSLKAAALQRIYNVYRQIHRFPGLQCNSFPETDL